MGGLVGMMAAEPARALACVGLAPSVPTRRTDPLVPIRRGTFGPEEYGIVDRHQRDQPTMPDLDDEERRLALSRRALAVAGPVVLSWLESRLSGRESPG
jgi:hypothetical protein